MEITGLNYEIDDYTRELVVKRLVSNLEKLLKNYNQDLKMARIKIEKRTEWGYKVRLSLELAGKEFFVKAKNKNISHALVEVREAMIPQIKSHIKQLNERY